MNTVSRAQAVAVAVAGTPVILEVEDGYWVE